MAKKNNLLSAAKTLKKQKMFFYRKKKENPIVYRYMLILGKGDLVRGYCRYNQKTIQKQQDFLFCYEKLKEDKKLALLYRDEKKKMHNLYNCARSLKNNRSPSEKTNKMIRVHTKEMKKLLKKLN